MPKTRLRILNSNIPFTVEIRVTEGIQTHCITMNNLLNRIIRPSAEYWFSRSAIAGGEASKTNENRFHNRTMHFHNDVF